MNGGLYVQGKYFKWLENTELWLYEGKTTCNKHHILPIYFTVM